MLSDYRSWLESELKLLGNASHHAYSFGQANMAKRAIERLDAELAGKIELSLTPDEARALLAELDSVAAPSEILTALRNRIAASLTPASSQPPNA